MLGFTLNGYAIFKDELTLNSLICISSLSINEHFLSHLMSSRESPSLKNSKLLKAVLNISSVKEVPLVFNGELSSLRF